MAARPDVPAEAQAAQSRHHRRLRRPRRNATTSIRPTIAQGEDPLRMQVLAPIHLSPHDPDTVYFGTQYLYRSRDRGTTWERLTGDLSYGDKTKIGDIPHQLVITISESPKKKGLIYTGTDDGRLYASVDDGKEFRELTAALPKRQWIAKVAGVAARRGDGLRRAAGTLRRGLRPADLQVHRLRQDVQEHRRKSAGRADQHGPRGSR